MQVGIIGAGIQARSAQLPAFKRLDEVEVTGIADINEKAANALAKKFQIPEVYTDYHHLINNPDIELVSICTPNHLHKEMAVECAEAGKHILIEKPMTTNLKDAEEILKATKDNNVKLSVVQNYRFFPVIKEAKNRIMEGRIGEIISIHAYGHLLQNFDRSWSLIEGSFGVLEDFGPHLIDIILYLNDFNDIKKVYATGGNFNGHLDIIVRAVVMVEFVDGAYATLDLSWVSGAKEVGLYVQGTGGLLHVDVRNNHSREIHQYSTPLDDLSSTISKVKTIAGGALNGSYFRGAKSYYSELIKEFIESIENNKEVPVTGEEAKKTVQVIECAYRSIKENRPIEC